MLRPSIGIEEESKIIFFTLHLLGIKMSSVKNIMKLRRSVGIGGQSKRECFSFSTFLVSQRLHILSSHSVFGLVQPLTFIMKLVRVHPYISNVNFSFSTSYSIKILLIF